MKILLKPCRDCDFGETERVARVLWMRLLPTMRHYYCRQCRSTLLAPKGLVESKQWMMSTFRNLEVPPATENVDKPGA